ncbi:unnamed protein product [Acanthosepion pharaonis]|uniref:Uncharacterized protein n=1 Tax=Acanthosepion pharaonis TaxID=158019 RepID=A0A812DTJ2_ACAPH|nr:unnamed protein product [Sepia pharaonis]
MTDVEYSDYETFPFFVKMVEIGQDVLETHLKSNCFEFFEKCLQLTYKFADKTQKATVLIGYGRAQTNIKGNYESGQEKLCQAIEVLDDLPCTYATAQAYQSLGFTLQRKGEVEEALRCLEEALKIETELDIPNNRLTLSTLSSLGIVNVFIGNFEDGKKYHLESLKRRLALLQTEKHPHIGACYNNLGLLYENMGEYDKALEYYEKGLQRKTLRCRFVMHSLSADQSCGSTRNEESQQGKASLLPPHSLLRLLFLNYPMLEPLKMMSEDISLSIDLLWLYLHQQIMKQS